MIRLAVPGDAAGLYALNLRFNGPGVAEEDAIAASLSHNRQELVVVSDRQGELNGFMCIQIKRSLCYTAPTAEITEVFVDEPYRRRGLARAMLDFGQKCCAAKYGVTQFTVLTGDDNLPAQGLYRSAGFFRENEVLFATEE